MTEEQKNVVIKYCVLPFILLNALYYAVVCLLCDWYFETVRPRFISLVKNVLSYMFEWSDIHFIYVRYPVELGINEKVLLAEYHDIFSHFIQGAIYEVYPVFVVMVTVLCFVWVVARLNRMDDEDRYKNDLYIRGIKKVTAKKFCELSSEKTVDSLVALPTESGYLYLSASRMKEHCMILGSTGSGKSQLLLNIVKDVLKSKETRLIIVDRKGEFYSYFGDSEKDTLFHPFDERGVKWDLFNEIRVEVVDGKIPQMPSDIAIIADVLYGVSKAKGEDKFWRGSASAVFQSAVCWCILNKKGTTAELLKLLRKPTYDIFKAFKGLPDGVNIGLGTLGSPESTTASSIMTTVQDGIRQLDVFTKTGSSWSVRDWIKEGSGNLYISTAGRKDEAFTSIVSLLIDMIGQEIKEFRDAKTKGVRFCIVIDELGALPALSTLIFLLTQARSKGVSVIIANQTISKLKDTYGNNETENIIANCKSKFIFSLKESNDAKYISEQIGSAEVARATHNKSESTGIGKAQNTVTEGKSIVQNIAFLPSEIMMLEVGQAVVTLPQLAQEVAKVQFLQASLKQKNAEYMPATVREYRVDEAAKVLKDIPAAKTNNRREYNYDIERF